MAPEFPKPKLTSPPNVQLPLNLRLPAAVEYSGLSRSRLYELIAAGEIDSVKIGRSRLIPTAAIDAYFERLAVKAGRLG